MNSCDENASKKKNNNHWIFFLRQFFSCSMVVVYFFICGMYQGAPTVIIPQLRKEANSTDAVSPEMASWLPSMSPYCGVPWCIILPLLGYRYGRRILLIIVSVNTLVGNIVFYNSTTAKELLISLAIEGLSSASVLTITIMVTSEYTSPKYRGIIMTFKAATYFWGIWISNAIGTYYHWRNIGIVIFVCGIYNLSSIFCCESPYWLATKGRFDECAKIHRWLKGTDEDSEEELRKLILSHQEHLNIKAKFNGRKDRNIIRICNIMRSRCFYKPFLYALLTVSLYHFSGKLAYTVYALDVIKKITSSEETAYNGMLILDGVTVLGMYIGCAMSKIVSRRTQLLLLSFIAVFFLYVLSAYLYMINRNIISQDKYVSLSFLTGFSISVSCGPMILATSYSAELSPLQYRSYFLCCLSVMATIIYGSVIKITPTIFKHCGTHGAFLFYGIVANVIIIFLYKYLPETKDKTIQEIQQCILSRDDCYAKSKRLKPIPLLMYSSKAEETQ